jgi:predicted TIM-barrel fold metal-dependent hydrolase
VSAASIAVLGVFAADYPFPRQSKADIAQFVAEFASDDDREKFVEGNARSLFKLDLPVG